MSMIKLKPVSAVVLMGLAAAAAPVWADASGDKALMVDHAAYKAQQGEIKGLNDTGNFPVRNYSLSKSQCWLDVSFHEYTRNDRSAFPAEAMVQSKAITEYLKAGGDPAGVDNPANQTPLVNKSAKLRDDLWAQAESLKGHPGYKCAAQLVACSEVELVHAGNEYNQQGWRHAKPYIQIAEDKLGAAKGAAEGCTPPPAPVVPVAAPARQVVAEKIVLNANVLFKFDRRTLGDMLSGGREQLDNVVTRLNEAYERIDRLDIVGYTDRLGTDAYNATLSNDRAYTVQTYLSSHGLNMPMSAKGRGPADPLVQCGVMPHKQLTECLQPNRRVEITIHGVPRVYTRDVSAPAMPGAIPVAVPGAPADAAARPATQAN